MYHNNLQNAIKFFKMTGELICHTKLLSLSSTLDHMFAVPSKLELFLICLQNLREHTLKLYLGLHFVIVSPSKKLSVKNATFFVFVSLFGSVLIVLKY